MTKPLNWIHAFVEVGFWSTPWIGPKSDPLTNARSKRTRPISSI